MSVADRLAEAFWAFLFTGTGLEPHRPQQLAFDFGAPPPQEPVQLEFRFQGTGDNHTRGNS